MSPKKSDMDMALTLRIDLEDVEALELLTERVGQGVKHVRWALAEYRKALATKPASEATPIPKEDLTL